MNDDVKVLCDISCVSRCGYYKWLAHADEPDKDYEDYLTIKKVFDGSKGKFGWRSIKMALLATNHKKIQRIMRKYDLTARVRRRNPYRAAKKKTMEHRIFPNVLQRKFNQLTPFKVFCTDITYIPFLRGFVYVSVIKDIASGEVIAWNVSLYIDMVLVIGTMENMPKDLCENALTSI